MPPSAHRRVSDPHVSVGRVTAKRVDVPLFDLVRELALERKRALRTDAVTAAFHRDAPARWGACADKRRVVAGDAGEGKPTCQFPPLGPVREAGARTDNVLHAGRSSLPSVAPHRALRRVRRMSGASWGAKSGLWVLAYALQSVAWPPTRRGSRRSIRLTRQKHPACSLPPSPLRCAPRAAAHSPMSGGFPGGVSTRGDRNSGRAPG